MASQVERLARQFRRKILARDRQALAEVFRVYEKALDTALARGKAYHAALVEAADAAGVSLLEISQLPHHPSWALQRDRLEALARAIADELEKIAVDVEGIIAAAKRQGIELGIEEARAFSRALIRGQVPRNLLRLVDSRFLEAWGRPPLAALENLVSFTADGSPLIERLSGYGDEAVETIRTGLRQSFLLGEGVDLMARRIVGAMNGNRSRALLVSRTETMRAYRVANHESMRANPEIVHGWIWSAELGPDTCAACLDEHGTEYGPDETLEDHPNGRCAPIPKVASNSELADTLGVPALSGAPYSDPYAGMESGADWLAAQSPALQDRILGGARGALYRDPSNGIGLSDLTTERHSKVWGRSIGVKPLRDLV